MSITLSGHTIAWEKLPDDFRLDDEPVDNLDQPVLASALTESLELAGLLRETTLVATNFGLCATVDGKLIIKAPDWVYVPSVLLTSSSSPRRSYTPNLEGDKPAVVMEFLSETEGGEYSSKPTYPPGKWFFYEQILQVPNYVIFEPRTGQLEVYQLGLGRYQLQIPDTQGRYWLEGIDLFLGLREGTKAERTGYWLRWWNAPGELLLWGTELVEQERQLREQERQRQDRMAAKLRELGLNPEEL
ncbi:Uma2 family endonuclease [Leptolyngbya sp. FACHB-261]|uniref:Uma2 family endonuclease n=1 Tax=Leptolyngbya sp. FACHB-261 TaxID=2692806 RepID=UPI001688DFD1|nr:Uma2 family endonuclease [Leptolyngbya sp. FACHB-261]MBD2101262.1 Uma2 family endonuclease [Leptolyngbya sp. FACHB-261]